MKHIGFTLSHNFTKVPFDNVIVCRLHTEKRYKYDLLDHLNCENELDIILESLNDLYKP